MHREAGESPDFFPFRHERHFIIERTRVNPLAHEQDVTIWLVEDNKHFRDTIFELINQSDGMRCPRSFASCEEALEALESDPPPEVILLDIGLPGMSGVEGVSRFKAVSPSTHIIILTVYDDNENVFNALCAGASGYLLKDAPPQQTVDAIEDVLAGGAPMNMHIARKVLDMFVGSVPQKKEYGLTEREKQILKLMVEGLTKKKIADKLFLSYHTVNTHLKNIYSKLQVNTRSGAVSKVFKERLL